MILHGKAGFYHDLSMLFDSQIITLVNSPINGENTPSYVERVKILKDKMDLMGYSINKCANKYQTNTEYDFDLTFDILLEASNEVQFDKGYENTSLIEMDYWDLVIQNIQRKYEENDIDRYYLSKEDPYLLLRVAVENPGIQDAEIYWDITRTIEAGYISQVDLFHPIEPRYKTILVTEGKSDQTVIQKSIQAYRPHLLKFFTFINRENGYSMNGTGNMKKFYNDLVSIGITNNILFLFDNDTAGRVAYNELVKKEVPPNFKIAILPNLDCLKDSIIIGPEGQSTYDVNEYASSIECFLDFSKISSPITFRWISYDDKKKRYQGRIENKKELNDTIDSIGTKPYDNSKIMILLNRLFEVIKE